MGILERFCKFIWLIVFICLCFCGGFLIFPIIGYIVFNFSFDKYGPDDMFIGIFDKVKYTIENIFNQLRKINILNIKLNGEFWK